MYFFRLFYDIDYITFRRHLSTIRAHPIFNPFRGDLFGFTKSREWLFFLKMAKNGHHLSSIYLSLYNTNSVCVCVCLSSIGGQTAGPIMTKFGTHMRIDLGMVPTKYWPHEWPGSVGSLGPISESGLSCSFFCEPLCGK